MFVKESDYSFCSVVGRTDVGCKRSVNEDSIGRADTPNGLAVVICDGMGGNVGGKIASETAVDAILRHLREQLYNNPQEAVSNAIQEANKAVLKKVSLRPELTGMGCTCVLLLIDKSGTVNIGHVGDSRIYLIRDGMANHLTKDQSYVQMLVDEGRLTPQEAEHHPRNNEITNAVGMMNMTPPVIRERAINPVAGDCFLLCSDGLSKLVPEEDIVKIVSARSFSTERRAEMLIDAAKNNGGSDNISVQLVEFSVSPAEVKLSKERRRMIMFTSSVVLAVVLILTGFFVFRNRDKEILNVERGNLEVTDTSGTQTQSKGSVSENIRIPESSGSGNADLTEKDDKGYSNMQRDSHKQGTDSTGSKGGDEVNVSNSDCVETPDVEDFVGIIMHFPANENTHIVPSPELSSRKYQASEDKNEYSEDCCDRIQSDYRNQFVKIKSENGGLLIVKTKEVDSWKGYYIIIDKYISNGEQKELPEPKRIKIVFD